MINQGKAKTISILNKRNELPLEEESPLTVRNTAKAVHNDMTFVQFRSIFEHVSDGLVVIDLQSGMLLTANPAYCQMHGYSYEEILTLNPLDLIPPQFHQKFISFLDTVRSGQQFTCEANCRRPDGVAFYIEIKSVPFLYEEQICALSVIRDVTDRVQMEQSIQEKNIQLEQALADLKQAQVSIIQSAKMSSLGQLVAGVAHEINNPVSFVQGNLKYVHDYTQDLLTIIDYYQTYFPEPDGDLQTILEDVDLSFLRKDLEKILKSMDTGSERIASIVRSLRNFSRMDEADLKTVDIHEGLDHALMLLSHRFAECEQHSTIKIVRNYGQVPIVSCYPGLLNQVFMNILNNAVDTFEQRYAQGNDINNALEQESNQIIISTTLVDQQWVEIAIANNGLPIPEHHKARVFDPFFTTKPVGEGIGMNMSISYQIVTKRHGGSLKCLSNTETGTKFVIRIPVEQAINPKIKPLALSSTPRKR